MRLEGKRLLTIVSEDYDDLEFHYPIIRLKEEGARIDIASLAKGEKINGKYGLSTVSDMSFGDVDITQYDGLLIPGGWSPDYLRRFDDVLHYTLPSETEIKKIFTNRLSVFQKGFKPTEKLIEKSKLLSQAELVKICDDAIKESILYDSKITENQLLKLVEERIGIYSNKEA